MGQFQIIGDEYPTYPNVYVSLEGINWYRHFYCGGERTLSYAVHEAITRLDNQIDYRQYDNDGPDGIPNSGDDDGFVDLLIMWFRFHNAGVTDCNTYNGIANLTGIYHNWFIPGVYTINTGDIGFNGQPIKIHSGSGHIGEGASKNSIAIHIHELGHLMGLYQHFHAGVWNIMGAINGVGVMNTFERKDQLGWLPSGNVTTISTPGIYNLNLTDYETTAKVINVYTINNGKYVIENRSGNSFYSRAASWVMPGNGILFTYYPDMRDSSNFTIEAGDHRWDYIRTPGGICGCNNNYTYSLLNGIFQHNGPSNNGQFPMYLLGVCTNEGCKTHPGSIGATGNVFRMGYNQVFSPWSNPRTVRGLNNQDIVIELTSHNADSSYSLYIHYDLPNGYQNTSPSKPLWLRVTKDYFDPGNQYRFRPKLEWIANTEPDIAGYKILRGLVINQDIDPNYNHIATINSGSTNNWIDENVILYDAGSGSLGCTYQKRTYAYRIIAFDSESPQKQSVRSDRSLISGFANPCEEHDSPFAPGEDNGIPKQFSISHYPNPFNPTTQIKFSLPQNTFVSVKVYNVTGELVATLVDNEYRNAGYYEVSFDGTNFASGIYFYKIEAGNFKDSKKMVLIK